MITFYKLLQYNLISYITQLSEKLKGLVRKRFLIDLVAKQMFKSWDTWIFSLTRNLNFFQKPVWIISNSSSWRLGIQFISMHSTPGCPCLWKKVKPNVKINRTVNVSHCSMYRIFFVPFILGITQSDPR